LSDQLLWSIGLTLIVAGFVLVFVATILLSLKGSSGKGKVKAGGVVIIGPVPIIFGTDKQTVKALLILSIILVTLLLIWLVFSQILFR
jgi:uncharacterized protein (TIGR00304 family)